MRDHGREARPVGERPFLVRVEFDPFTAPNDIARELATDPSDRLFVDAPQLATNDAGRAELHFTVNAADLWISILLTMTVVRQSGFLPIAVQIVDQIERNPAAVA